MARCEPDHKKQDVEQQGDKHRHTQRPLVLILVGIRVNVIGIYRAWPRVIRAEPEKLQKSIGKSEPGSLHTYTRE
ncbi:MAG: hypothetical protein DMG08_22900 [Acidobacteria bacterium]|nr:MAG: hypothetical protein DMG08_22900 [Acidobacteriota bacterium]